MNFPSDEAVRAVAEHARRLYEMQRDLYDAYSVHTGHTELPALPAWEQLNEAQRLLWEVGSAQPAKQLIRLAEIVSGGRL